MKGGVSVVGLLVALSMVLLAARQSQAAVSCGQVSSALSPCLPYLTSGGTPSPSCCNGVRSLRDMTPSQPDRKAACNCLKDAASRYPNLKPDAATNLPTRCGVPFGIPISASTNCDAIP